MFIREEQRYKRISFAENNQDKPNNLITSRTFSLPKKERKVLEVLAPVEPPQEPDNARKEQADAKGQQVPGPEHGQDQTDDQHDGRALRGRDVEPTKDQDATQERTAQIPCRQCQTLCPPVAHIGRQSAQVRVHSDRLDLAATDTGHAGVAKLVESNSDQLKSLK